MVPVAVVVPSASADAMDLLSLKQRELEKALNLQEQLGLVEGRRADLAKRRRRKEEELRALEQEGRGMEEEVNRIKRTPGYKDQVRGKNYYFLKNVTSTEGVKWAVVLYSSTVRNKNKNSLGMTGK